MIRSFSALVLALFTLNHFVVVRAIVVAKIWQGDLSGTADVSRAGIRYFSFRGVPYAQAPIGHLRFQDPHYPKPWTGIREAKNYADDCPQFGWTIREGYYGNEDCLYLNIFTPQMSGANDSRLLLPILVWIHGGGFTIGSASLYRPDYLMDKPIVVVTVNYRLGALGFLHLDDGELPGNYGMKDQIAALQWVQNNIEAFGGDPQRVTIAGQSAGGASVHWHMLSRLSKGLFHRAISLSGTAMAAWAEVPRRIARDRGFALARSVGCNYESAGEIVKCLKRTPAHELIKAQEKFTVWMYHPMSLGPVPENEESSAWQSGPLDTNVPWLIGFTSNEQEAEVASVLAGSGEYLTYLNENYKMLFPILFMYNVYSQIRTESEMRNVTERVRQFYFEQETIHRGTLTQLQNLWSDSLTVYDISEAALRHPGKTYFYVFSHQQEHSFAEFSNKNYLPSGPVHCDDLISIFNTSEFPQPLNSADKRVSEFTINVLTNFITTGDPNGAPLGFEWRSLSSGSKIEFLSIDENPEMRPWHWGERFSFWKNLNLRNVSSRFAASSVNDVAVDRDEL